MKTQIRTSRHSQIGLVAFICFWGSVGCNQIGQRSGDTGSYLNTDIDGMESGDEALAGIKYDIICDNQPEKRISGKIDENNKTNISFPEDELKLGAKCALEVTADAREKAGVGVYEWKARRKDGTPYVGLFYSSNFANVEISKEQGKTQKYIAFKVIKTYGIAYNDPFIARIPVNFEREEGAILPESAGLLASLECRKAGAADAQPFYESSIGAKMGANPEQRLFDFKLSANKMQGVTCTKLSIAVQNIPLYEGQMNHVTFTTPQVNANPETDKNLLFNPVTVSPNQESFGQISCDGRNPAGKCTSIKINKGSELWFAVVVVSVGGSDKEFIVTPGFGLGVSPNLGSQTVNGIQNHINQIDPPEKYTYFDPSQALSKLIGASDDTKAILKAPYTDGTATSIAAHKVDLSALSGGQVKHFKAAYTHGFRTVSEGFLNSFPGGRWFARTKVSDGVRLIADVIIAGGKRYFETIDNLRPASSQGAFFTTTEYQRDNTPADNRYRTYGFQGGSFAESCAVNFDYFRHTLGQKTLNQLTQSDAKLDACEISDAAKLAQLKPNNLVFVPRYYLWGWHAFRFE